ncbi:MAG: anhydro-N-acetylmuramic acid kinase [Oscillatoriales cyanobacterium RM2_1_1]|nr:anhydro-N-acetylmuramic acid kinase [Oscillatoriales cyanobacterium RM2_1_1]
MTRAVGLISGTSVDGIDAVLVELTGLGRNLEIQLLAGETYPYPEGLRQQILRVCGGEAISCADLAALDDAIALVFAEAALRIQQGQEPAELIGSHGQTVFHRPPPTRYSSAIPLNDRLSDPSGTLGYSLQLGRGAVIAQTTGIPTVSNFRVADLAVGGQGAPLVSILDAYVLSHPDYNRCIQNIGGIGNVTYLPRTASPSGTSGKRAIAPKPNLDSDILGWDTGPGNTLLDLAVQQFSEGIKTYDHNGQWAAQGQPCIELVERWLQQDFFHQPPPKSTGREHFGLDYLQQCLVEAEALDLKPADILATLTELTVAAIVQSYYRFLPRLPDQILLCGGGCHNLYLRQRLEMLLYPIPVLTTAAANLDVNFKEAIAFALLADLRIQNIPGNLPQVTGASTAVLLGEVHYPRISDF